MPKEIDESSDLKDTLNTKDGFWKKNKNVYVAPSDEISEIQLKILFFLNFILFLNFT